MLCFQGPDKRKYAPESEKPGGQPWTRESAPVCLFQIWLRTRGSAGGVDDVVSSESFQELQVLLHIHIVFFPDRGNWCDIFELLLSLYLSRNT